MKKIVALVLSLVMVLGLATVAFGATAEYVAWPATVEADDTDFSAGYQETALPTVNKAVAPVAPALNGSVAYYSYNSKLYIEGTAADCDMYFTVKGKTTPVLYLKQIGSEDYIAVATEFTNFGKSCGQVKIAGVPAADTKYYTFTDANDDVVVYAEDTTVGAFKNASTFVLAGGKMVPVVATNLYDYVVDHSWVFSKNDKGVVVSAKCADCAATAAVYSTYTAIPVGADYVTEGAYFLVVNAPVVDAETDKVESAETFDAGIAMYVGMSVMAAAGSAVVLKKKD